MIFLILFGVFTTVCVLCVIFSKRFRPLMDSMVFVVGIIFGVCAFIMLFLAIDGGLQKNNNIDINIDNNNQISHIIELEANITTGYSWYVEDVDNFFKVTDNGYVENNHEDGIKGIGGIQSFVVKENPIAIIDNTFKMIDRDKEYCITFLYYRSWEGKETAIRMAACIVSFDDSGEIVIGEPVITKLPRNIIEGEI